MQSATQSTLSSLVEAHISALIQESATVNRHSRRGGLISATTADDTPNNNNSKSNGGGGSSSNKRRRLIHHDDVNMALQWRGSEKLYVSGVSVPCVDNNAPSSPEKSSHNQTAAGGGRAKNALTQLLRNTTNNTTITTSTTVASLLKSSNVPRVDLNAYLHSELSIRPPSELGMTVHWLAVDGVTPMIPMNEVWNTKINANNNGGSGSSSVGGLDPLAPVLELDDDDNDDGSTMSKQQKQNDTSIRIRELQQRLLSEELQLYFSRVTSTIEHYSSSNNNNNNLSELYAVLNGIRSDTGIQELVPFLSRYVASGLMNKSNLQNTQYCMCLMKIFDAMLDNSNLHLDLHLHQMLSPVGTCVVAKKLSSRRSGSGSKYYEEEDHWSLRELAARCLVKACDMYGVQYTTMKPRIMKLLTQQALRLDRPLVTQYGGIVGISLFGPRAIDAFLLPVAKEYWECWDKELQALVNSSSGKKKRVVWREYELQMCQQALLDAVSMFMRGVNPGEQAKRVDIESFADVFGERLIPMQPEVTQYVSAII
jgi:transcription initiation factor TFIID subunit 6